MRWVWRAESGGFKTEYAALILLISTVVTAVFAFGLPTDVQNLYAEGICRINPDSEECRDGRPSDGGPGPEETEPSDEGTPEGEGTDGEGDTDKEGSADEEGADEDENSAYDPELAQAFDNADSELADAEQELADAEADLEDAGYDEAYDALIELVGDIIGYNDAKACITEGDIMACIWTVVGFTPWGKGAKLLKNSAKIIKLWNRFRKAKKARDAAQKTVNAAKNKLGNKKSAYDDALAACQIKSGKNSFVPGTPVLMGDGSLLHIEDIDVGDQVWAFDPITGEEGPREVTDLIEGEGATTLVDITAGAPGGGAQTITATDEHPFWVPEAAEWVQAAGLEPGTWLRTSSGVWAQITAIDVREAPHQRVHNLTVDGLHTYYVGADGTPLLVHNQNNPGDACRGTFEPSPKHGREQRGNAAPGPTNGQKSLDNSVPVGSNTTRRVGVDKENNEIVIFDETHPDKGIFHGHVRSWKELNPKQQSALIKAGLVNKKGKIK